VAFSERKAGGVGRKIVELLEEEAREQECSRCCVKPSAGFFAKDGIFEVDGGELGRESLEGFALSDTPRRAMCNCEWKQLSESAPNPPL